MSLQFNLRLGGQTYSILALQLPLEINADWQATLQILSLEPISEELLLQPASIISHSDMSENIIASGLLVGVSNEIQSEDGYHQQLVLRSVLTKLDTEPHSRVFVHETLPDIIAAVLQKANVSKSDYQTHFTQTYPELPSCIQHGETNLTFFNRLLAANYLLYTAGTNTPELQLYESLQQLPQGTVQTLPYRTQAQRVPNETAIFNIAPSAISHVKQLIYRAHNFDDPQNNLEVMNHTQSTVPSAGTLYQSGMNYKTLEDGKQLMAEHQASLDATREGIQLTTDCANLQLGHVLQVTGYPTLSNKSLRILRIEHHYRNEHDVPVCPRFTQIQDETQEDSTSGYYNVVTVIDAAHQTYPIAHVTAQYHGLLRATIETPAGAYDHLDQEGRYTVKYDFDENEHPMGHGSAPMPALQSGTGPNSGMHFPFTPSTDVLIQCLEGDINQSIILGALPTQNSPSLVTQDNNQHHLLQTPIGHQLRLDDTTDTRSLLLATPQQQNQLLMTDTGTTLATKLGAMDLMTGSHYHEETTQNVALSATTKHTQTVHGQHEIKTTDGNISHSSAKDVTQRAQGALTQTAEQNTETNVGTKMSANAKQNITLQAQTGTLTLQTAQDKIHLHSAKSLRLVSGQGITLAQGGGLIQFDRDGNLTLQGNEVDFNYQQINIVGNQVKMQPGGQAAALPMAPEMKTPDDKSEKVAVIDVSSEQNNTSSPDITWDYLLSLDTALWKGTGSVFQSLSLGIVETKKALGVSGISAAGEVWGAHKNLLIFIAKAAKLIVEERNPLFDLAEIILTNYYQILPDCVLKALALKAGYEAAFITGRTFVGKKIVTHLAKEITKQIVIAIVETEVYKKLASEIVISAVAAADVIGTVITLVILESLVKESQDAAQRLQKQLPNVYNELQSRGLIGGYFIVEKVLHPYVNAIDQHNKSPVEFNQEAIKRYCHES